VTDDTGQKMRVDTGGDPSFQEMTGSVTGSDCRFFCRISAGNGIETDGSGIDGGGTKPGAGNCAKTV
jgi:hypothetical protein